MRALLCVALGALALHAAGPLAAHQDITRQIPVDAGFGDGSLTWPGLPGGYHFKLRIIAADGRLEICGVGVFTDAYSRSQERSVLRAAKFKMNGRTILEDLSYFARVNRRSDLDRGTANCRATSAAIPQAEVSFEIDWPDKRYRF